ncbi:hypothetical protein [Vibrio spartinae]|uniref:hypothetical protein n=1 Tax=Vibrio spartinae TaxID=1918945 RepID=UPI0013565E46|nr:hypothetical protein [Vibrio spartinae]
MSIRSGLLIVLEAKQDISYYLMNDHQFSGVVLNTLSMLFQHRLDLAVLAETK